MRPIPWLVRVGLFAVGFGVGLSHYQSPSTPQPIVIELRLAKPGSTTVSAPAPLASADVSPCSVPVSNPQILSASF